MSDIIMLWICVKHTALEKWNFYLLEQKGEQANQSEQLPAAGQHYTNILTYTHSVIQIS